MEKINYFKNLFGCELPSLNKKQSSNVSMNEEDQLLQNGQKRILVFDSFQFKPINYGKFSTVFIQHDLEGDLHSSHEGEIFRLHADGTLKPFQLMIMYNELYCYQKTQDEEFDQATPSANTNSSRYRFAYERNHKSMHSL